jgi:hypothetical protein
MTPTYELGTGFAREFARLSREEDRAFRKAVEKFIEALRDGAQPPNSLRIKRVQGTSGRCPFPAMAAPPSAMAPKRSVVRRMSNGCVSAATRFSRVRSRERAMSTRRGSGGP